MKRAWLVILLVACKSSDNDGFPVDPGGGGPPGDRLDGSTLDAFDPDGNTQLAGRVCLVTDLRALTACATTGADGLTVTLGTRTAMTMADGKFTMMTPAGSNLVWRVSGAGIVPSVMPFGPSNSIPAIGVEDFNELQNANSVVLTPGDGTIIARVVRNGTPQTGAVASVEPLAQFATKYDGPAQLAWTELATSTAGTVWIPGAPAGIAKVTVSPASGDDVIEDVRVEDQSITYVTIDLP